MPAPERPYLHGMPMTWAFTHMIDAFEERAGHCGSDAELRDLLEAALRELGFDYFALLHHASLTTGRTGLIRIDNYPSGWAVELAAGDLVADDPVHLARGRTNIGFLWEHLGALGPPVGEEVGVDEAEGFVHGDGDALAER